MFERLARIEPVTVLVVSAVIGSAIVATVFATGVTDIGGVSDLRRLDCDGGSQAVGFSEGGEGHGSAEAAARSFAADFRPDGRVPGEDYLVVEIGETRDASAGKRFAVWTEGRTVAILGVVNGGGGWTVGMTRTC